MLKVITDSRYRIIGFIHCDPQAVQIICCSQDPTLADLAPLGAYNLTDLVTTFGGSGPGSTPNYINPPVDKGDR